MPVDHFALAGLDELEAVKCVEPVGLRQHCGARFTPSFISEGHVGSCVAEGFVLPGGCQLNVPPAV